jgi:hypothetical protein
MSDDYRKYERACAKIKAENGKLLADFGQWLSGAGLTEKVIRKHVQNADAYINTFLLHEEPVPAREGAGHISIEPSRSLSLRKRAPNSQSSHIAVCGFLSESSHSKT